MKNYFQDLLEVLIYPFMMVNGLIFDIGLQFRLIAKIIILVFFYCLALFMSIVVMPFIILMCKDWRELFGKQKD